MKVRIDQASATSPYEQVRTQVARQINDGSLPVGTRLPTVRALAAELGIAPNTAARAYRELEEAGLLETRGRAGTFVGSGGDRSRLRLQQAAADYAHAATSLGISQDEALSIVRAALGRAAVGVGQAPGENLMPPSGS
ncbi:MAG: GntR family transcriptional regulator [Haloechinothrix sp.]